MPIDARTLAELNVNLVRLHDRVVPGDFADLIGFYHRAAGHAAKVDALYVLEAGVDMTAVTPASLVEFKERLAAVLAPVKRPIIVRTAIVNFEPLVQPLVDAWVSMSAPDDGMFSEVRSLAGVAAACDWLDFTDADFNAVEAALRTKPQARP
jgi:hypothetical protein